MDQKIISILIIEDDLNLGIVVRDYLCLCGYSVDLAETGTTGWSYFNKKNYDLCILDVMLPEIDGLTLLKMIRYQNRDIPVLILTAKNLQEDKLLAFRLGVDDYMVKPFNIEELSLRIEVFLKRRQNNAVRTIIDIGNYKFDYPNLTLEFQENKRTLTQKEADLLMNFCLHIGYVIKRDDILNNIWGNDDYFTGRSLDVFISRLRKYLNSDSTVEIQNLHSVGFRLIIR